MIKIQSCTNRDVMVNIDMLYNWWIVCFHNKPVGRTCGRTWRVGPETRFDSPREDHVQNNEMPNCKLCAKSTQSLICSTSRRKSYKIT